MESSPAVSRRDILKLGIDRGRRRRPWRGGRRPSRGGGPGPKRGGIVHIRHHVQPVHFDPK